ncbi:hypothetical protein HQ571_02410 [Candidatus Kuenenbacteria bacterium]|nr:hypothetical protein [Candidatus Kuenenbacteria bacterium]
MNWEKFNKRMSWVIIVIYLVVTIPIIGGMVGFLAYVASSYLFDCNVLNWVLAIILGALGGLGFGWFAYKDMTKKRGE